MLERQPQTDRGAIIENINREPRQPQLGDEGFHRGCQVSEVVFVLPLRRDGGETEAGEVRGDDAVGAREEGDQVAELVGGGGEAMQKEDDGCGGGASGAVEDVYAVGVDGGDLGLG